MRKKEVFSALKKINTQDGQIKIVQIIMWIVFAAVMLPLFWISFYGFMSVDDYDFAYNSETIWTSTHSIFSLLKGQLGYTLNNYLTYQGNYFSTYLLTVLLALFGRNAFYTCTFIALGVLLISEYILSRVVFVNILGSDVAHSDIVYVCFSCIHMLMFTKPSEGLYWYTGCIVYTLMYALMILLSAILIYMCAKNEISKKKLIGCETAVIILNIAVAGGNYISALVQVVLYMLFIIWLLFYKHKMKWMMLVNFVVYLLAFGVNVLSPGNNTRFDSISGPSCSAFGAIMYSIKHAVEYILQVTVLPYFVLGIMLIPVFLHIVNRKKFRYPYPMLVTVIAFGVFASHFTPTQYVYGNIDWPGRVWNLIKIGYFIFIYTVEFYWVGWCWRRHLERQLNMCETSAETNSSFLGGWIMGLAIMAMSLIYWGGTTLTSLSALMSLRNGEAQTYYEEYKERLVIYEDDSIKEAYVKPFSVYPYLLFYNDLNDTNPYAWTNECVALYFHKDFVAIEE
jgi:hypothetical protein